MQRGETMIQFHEQYLVDEEGNRKAVVVPISSWEQILEALDELDDIRAYDEAKREPSNPVPFEQALSEIRERMCD
jgi:PHD/YefM family antitoxin component YafN of YafNO toxin-antitoxin module